MVKFEVYINRDGKVAIDPIDDAEGTPLYRVYNPNAYALGMTGAHHYTADKGEYDGLAEIGWIAEDIAWYGVAQ